MLARTLRLITGDALSIKVALFLVSWGSLIILAPLIIRLCSRLAVPRPVALMILFSVLFSPASCFLISWYPLGLYLFLTCLTFELLFQRKRMLAALIAGLASCLSPVGIALSLALSFQFLFRERHSRIVARTALSALTLWGVAAYYTYCAIRFGSIVEPVRVQSFFGEIGVFPFIYLPKMIHGLIVGHLGTALNVQFSIALFIESLALVLVIILIVKIARERLHGEREIFALFTVASLLVATSTVQVWKTTYLPIGHTRLMLASIGFSVELFQGIRRYGLALCTMSVWLVLGIAGQILFSSGTFY